MTKFRNNDFLIFFRGILQPSWFDLCMTLLSTDSLAGQGTSYLLWINWH